MIPEEQEKQEVLAEASEATVEEPRYNQRVMAFKSNRLFFILGGFFLANAFIAEFIGIKIFAFEETFGLSPIVNESPLNFTAGVLLWPVVFIMTDVINDYYGVNGVRFLSYLTAALISYAFIMVYLAIGLSPAGFWLVDYQDKGVPDMQAAFSSVFGQGLWIIVASLIAFLIGQIMDALVFRKIKRMTGHGKIWVRATISTVFSQLFDSYLVIYIAFGLGSDWDMSLILSVATANYIYKVSVAILFIPLLYWIHKGINRYLGDEVATELRELALEKN